MAIVNRAFINYFLFLSSFSPLFLLLAIRFSTQYLRVACGVLAIVGAIGLSVVLRRAAKFKTAENVTPTHLDDKGADVSGYLATYLLPFLVLPNPTVTDQVAYLLFLVIAGIIYVRSRMLQINPLLYVFSYRVFAIIDSQEGFHGYLIARSDPSPDVTLRVARLRDNLLLHVG